jgi:hypothetical protein
MDGSSVMGAPNIGTPLVLESTFSIVSLGLGVSFFVVCFLWRGFCTPGRGCAGSFSHVKSFLTPWVMFVQVCSLRGVSSLAVYLLRNPKMCIDWVTTRPLTLGVHWDYSLPTTIYLRTVSIMAVRHWADASPIHYCSCRFRQNAHRQSYSLKPFILFKTHFLGV